MKNKYRKNNQNQSVRKDTHADEWNNTHQDIIEMLNDLNVTELREVAIFARKILRGGV